MKSISSISILALAISQAASTYAQQEVIEEVIVTGSRTIQDGSQAPTPVTAMTAEALEMSAPSNIPDALNKLPQFTGSSSQAAGETFNAGSAPLGNYLNLRALNSSRVLVLLDGQRVAPTDRTNAVDVNVLPQMLVERVDVVTGGASAIYGSDAVSGVVNWILDTDYEGLKVNVQGGTSAEGDADSFKFGLAGGLPVGDRGHFVGSVETYENDGVPHLFDRDWAHGTNGHYVINGARTLTGPLRRNSISNGGSIISGVLATFYPAPVEEDVFPRFNQDGTIAPMDMGEYLRTDWSIGGDGGIWGDERTGGTSIAGTLDTQQAFGRFTFDITDTMEAYAQGIFSNSDTSFNSTPNNHISGNHRESRIYTDNPYLDNLQADARLALTTSGEEYIVVGRIFNDIPLVTNDTENEYQSFQLGMRGDINASWEWNATYNWGEATQNASFNEFKMREFYAAIDAVRDGDGNIVCRVTLVNPGYMDDCVPMNIIGDGNITREAFDYTRGNSAWEITNEMAYFNANIVGELFELPAGPVQLAFGAEHRTQELNIVSNSDPTFFFNAEGTALDQAKIDAFYEGIRTFPSGSSPLLFDSINVGVADGEQTVNEYYAELSLPLLEGASLAESLSLNLAARNTDYETSGRVTTWKVGTSWEPVSGLRIRANQSRDIAAPDLNALYAGETLNFGGFDDTHMANPSDVSVFPTQSRSGNPDLQPEKADTTTFGIVFQPDSVAGLTMSLDWYKIEIEDVIAQANTQQLFDECEASNGTAAACDLFIRNPALPFSDTTAANRLRKIIVKTQNLALLETSGVDAEIRYSFPLAAGELSLAAYANYLDSFTTTGSAGGESVGWVGHTYTQDNLSTGMPRWKGMLVQTFRTDSIGVSLNERFTGRYQFNLGGPDEVWADPVNMPNEVYVDLNAAYYFGADKNYEVFLNVQNLFDVEPPNTPVTVENLTVPALKADYDVIGRYFTIGGRVEF